MYGWRVDVAALASKLKARSSPTPIAAHSQAGRSASGSDDSQTDDESDYETDGGSDSEDDEDSQSSSLEDDDLEYLLRTLAEPRDIRSHLFVVDSIIWLSRNYMNPHGRVSKRGLWEIPETAQIEVFRSSMGLDKPDWLPLRP